LLEAVRQAAVKALTDRSQFFVDAETYAKFVAALDALPVLNTKLHRTMQTSAPWDSK
jgi:uncharacterized protein (DUF1778 family)